MLRPLQQIVAPLLGAGVLYISKMATLTTLTLVAIPVPQCLVRTYRNQYTCVDYVISILHNVLFPVAIVNLNDT